MNIEKLKERKEQMQQAFDDCSMALEHDEYAKPFVFKRMDKMHSGLVNHPLLKGMVDKCVSANIGFDPSLALQHIEREALEQFNAIALEKIKGTSIPVFMEMRYELELLMLKDRHDHYCRELAKAEKNLLEAVTGVELGTEAEPVVKSEKKKGKK